jgi:hypothetical protein
MTERRAKSTSKQDASVLRRATYYLRRDQIKALKVRAASEERQLSALVREAVDRYLGRPGATRDC